MKRKAREASAAGAVTVCALTKRHKRQKGLALTILQLPLQSVRLKMRIRLTKSARKLNIPAKYAICLRILKRKTDLNVLQSCRLCMVFTGRITADVYFHKGKIRKKLPLLRDSKKMPHIEPPSVTGLQPGQKAVLLFGIFLRMAESLGGISFIALTLLWKAGN